MNKYNKLNYSLNFDEMRILNPDADIIPYTDLNKIFNIYELFKNKDKVIILYLLQNSHSGHYVCVFFDKNRVVNFFDSYGMQSDGELDELSPLRRMQLNEQQNRLTEILDPLNTIYNNIQLQGDGTQTCGMFVSHRLHNSHKTAYEYYKMFKNSKQNPDEIVANYCLKILENTT